MKRKKMALLLGLLFVILLSVALGLMLYFGVGSDKEEEDTYSVSYIDKSELPTKIEVSNDKGQYAVVPAQQSDTSSSQWTVEDFQNVPIYPTKTELIGSQMKELKAEKVFEAKNSLSSYGLDSPQATVTAQYPDGSSITLEIGKQNPEKSGYYCKLDSSEEIALISNSSAQAYFNGKTDLIDLTLVPYVSTSDSNGEDTDGVQSCTIWRQDLPESIVVTKGDDGNLSVTSPAGKSISDDTKTLITHAISGLSAQSVEAFNPTGEQLQQYGLDSPLAEVTYQINGETTTFYIGSVSHTVDTLIEEDKPKTQKEYYVLVKDRPVVYSVDETDLPWLTIQVE